jgi:pimeloyl-ACP methyl ester carboxylesterase
MCRFTDIAGRGPFHFICIPGLVPDGPETFLRQMSLFRRYGSLSLVTYEYDAFSLNHVIDGLSDKIREMQELGRRVIVVAVSVGGGICLELLRRKCELADSLAGLILMSPCASRDDLSPMLGKIITGIEQDVQRKDEQLTSASLERGRAFFRSLAARSFTKETRDIIGRWRSLLHMLTPQGLLELQERPIRNRIEKTLASIPTHGAIQRVLSITEFHGLEKDPRAVRPLSQAPTLILWGSRERHTLDMTSFANHTLSCPDLAARYFPQVEIQWLYTATGEDVPHASLLKHSKVFNAHLRRYLRILQRTLPFIPRLSMLGRTFL